MDFKKPLLLIVFLVGLGTLLRSQQVQLYGADYLPQGLMLNPGAQVDYDVHFGIPLLSGIHVKYGFTNVTVNDIFKIEENRTINDRINDKIDELDRDDHFTVRQQLEILSAGFRTRKGLYLSAGWYQEADAFLYFPKDPAILAYEGNAGNNLDRFFKASDGEGSVEVASVFHFGINKKVSKRLTLGARAKLYSSIADFRTLNNTGTLRTYVTPDGNNIYRHSLSNLNVGLESSGTDGFTNLDAKTLAKNALFSGNYGLGIDLGLTYNIGRQWLVRASLVDLGFVYHGKKTKEYFLKGDYEFDGIGLVFPSLLEGPDVRPYYQELRADFESRVKSDSITGFRYTTLRPTRFYGGAEYRFGEPAECNCLQPDNGDYIYYAGVTVAAINRPRRPQMGVTGYLDARLLPFLRTRVSYTADAYSKTNLGFLISTQINSFNFYLTADNMLRYTDLYKAKTLGVQLGFQFIIDK